VSAIETHIYFIFHCYKYYYYYYYYFNYYYFNYSVPLKNFLAAGQAGPNFFFDEYENPDFFSDGPRGEPSNHKIPDNMLKATSISRRAR
jgi:hypothetical protein